MLYVRAFSLRWSASFSIVADSVRKKRLAELYLSLSKDGTIRLGVKVALTLGDSLELF